MTALKVYVVIPNWNGADRIRACLDSLKNQTHDFQVVVVDNGSVDDSVGIVGKDYPSAVLIRHDKNEGFAGGVNAGIKYALHNGGKYVALLNNDAVADQHWLEHLVQFLDKHDKAGIATSKICGSDKTHLDSTGDIYTTWGLPFPRGRGEKSSDKYDSGRWVFGASGGASLYRINMLKEIGLFDDKFFAYYEDVDISFRAQLAGWHVGYEPKAIVYHEIGATSSKLKSFTTYQTIKNLPMLFWKNVPIRLMPMMLPRFLLAYTSFVISAIARGQIIATLKGELIFMLNAPGVFKSRHHIQKTRKVDDDYIRSILAWDLPPNARRLRQLRSTWRRLTGRTST
jgi:GT2 family glycosyltransferase